MGMYTELHYNAELVQNVPEQVLSVLGYMVDPDRKKPSTLPDHALFSTARWQYMFCSDSYYFAADTHSTLRFDEIARSWFLCIRCNLKNYENEIALFVNWLNPYVRAYDGDFLGFSRYEESEDPDIIRKRGDAE